jgi:transposase
MADLPPDLRRKIIELDESDLDITIRQIAARFGVDADTVKDVLVEHLVATGGTRLPKIRRSLNRLAARSNYL